MWLKYATTGDLLSDLAREAHAAMQRMKDELVEFGLPPEQVKEELRKKINGQIERIRRGDLTTFIEADFQKVLGG